MDFQQLAVITIVIAASVYLGRNLWAAWKRLRSPTSSGCATGCGKCAYAANPKEKTAFRQD